MSVLRVELVEDRLEFIVQFAPFLRTLCHVIGYDAGHEQVADLNPLQFQRYGHIVRCHFAPPVFSSVSLGVLIIQHGKSKVKRFFAFSEKNILISSGRCVIL